MSQPISGVPAQITPHQAKLFAHELTLQHGADDAEKLTRVLLDAQVDLNPHQVDAALFAFRSPLSKGAILADEVGLGKTIEAGLVVTQKWVEGKRNILVICPASLRAQWRDELAEKFFLPAEVIEAKSYNAAVRAGVRNPLDRTGKDAAVLICSYQFAAGKETDLIVTPWNMVVIDEAHRLRNVYKPGAKTSATLRRALADVPKILLTATPLQNSLMELYGLVSVIDEYAFGDAKTFRERYSRVTNDETFDDLKARLAPICHRTLRRQVTEYVRYTNRVPLTQEFHPTPDEQSLYDLVSDYLRRPNLKALPNSQRTLMVLVMRKLLASSTFAIAGSLDSLARRLHTELRRLEAGRDESVPGEDATVDELIDGDIDGLSATDEEWPEDVNSVAAAAPFATPEELNSLRSEILELEALRDQATSITENAKGSALLRALHAAFEKAGELGGPGKAIVFTESRRTQQYLVQLLSEAGYADQLVLFNGSNNDPRAKEIHQAWVEHHKGTDRVTGSRTADVRSALVDEFRNSANIMIATEAAAEGVNLQFCSIVVNYDLPWNPQRIEQRIGRCHRYGQKHDVVVVNFLNRDNAADQRVFELLDEKFRLFSGVFGASDEVLGAVESGVDVERRIVDIYQTCRTPAEIDSEFDRLREELDSQIQEVMDDTRQKLLENFDAEVHDRLRVNLAASREHMGRAERLLWAVTRFGLADHAEFNDPTAEFVLTSSPGDALEAPLGRYRLSRDVGDDPVHRYRPSHPLALWVIECTQTLELPPTELTFDYSGWEANAVAIEPLRGHGGMLTVDKLVVAGVETEEHLLFAGRTDDGERLTSEQVRRLFDLPAQAQPGAADPSDSLAEVIKAERGRILDDLSQRQATWFQDEIDKLDRWADDRRHALRSSLKDMDNQVKDLKRDARTAGSLPDKLALQRKVRSTETERDRVWREYDEAARQLEHDKDDLIDRVQSRLDSSVTSIPLFAARWRMI